jgi:hypothetical protein
MVEKILYVPEDVLSCMLTVMFNTSDSLLKSEIVGLFGVISVVNEAKHILGEIGLLDICMTDFNTQNKQDIVEKLNILDSLVNLDVNMDIFLKHAELSKFEELLHDTSTLEVSYSLLQVNSIEIN